MGSISRSISGSISSADILGGGPAGLYAAILLRRLMPQVRLRVWEQNPRGATSASAWCSPIRRWNSSTPTIAKLTISLRR
jgi:flavin-dependent dehydrogenase